jgi:hypothetical protein
MESEGVEEKVTFTGRLMKQKRKISNLLFTGAFGKLSDRKKIVKSHVDQERLCTYYQFIAQDNTKWTLMEVCHAALFC